MRKKFIKNIMENWKILIKDVENLIVNKKKISETQTMVSLVLKILKI